MTKHFGSNETLAGKQLSMLDSRNNNFEALNFVARKLSREKKKKRKQLDAASEKTEAERYHL